ncbi:MAG TPA: hypothetical protein VF174_01125 [Micromonosporaceae bacterium]
MTQENPPTDRPLEETPQVRAAIEDETTVPQLVTDGVHDPSMFREPRDVPADFPPTEDVIGAPYGGGTGGPGPARTGAEQPWDAEDVVIARGADPTPERVERLRRELEEEGPAAVERTVP